MHYFTKKKWKESMTSDLWPVPVCDVKILFSSENTLCLPCSTVYRLQGASCTTLRIYTVFCSAPLQQTGKFSVSSSILFQLNTDHDLKSAATSPD